ncbi:hypothetical protein [uncultured Roseobacter sp.]|uniref:hypothetical protein n=1 Tax=uncultured Roseobacter sp. TaxID=114847 RepID=UPI00260961DF|nr:hypothetical protein [uncultured Roseobacter sp.]
MDNNQGLIGMALGSWLVAAAAGALVAILLWVLGSWSFMQGAFMGFVVFAVLGAVVSWIMTRPLPAPQGRTPAAVDKPAPAAAAASTKPKVKPTTRLPGQEDLAARKGSWKYEGAAEAKPAPQKKAPAKKAAPAAASGDRPAGFSDTAREGGADDLKLISGVGPKLEETLNSLGIWHFDQVAGLKKKDIAWVDERLRFKGRIERDDWVGQAKTLAKGGETEASKKKRKS